MMDGKKKLYKVRVTASREWARDKRYKRRFGGMSDDRLQRSGI